MQKVRKGFILPSAAITISPRQIENFQELDMSPEVGDVVYGRVTRVGEHGSLENREGRFNLVTDGTCALFVYENRYSAPERRRCKIRFRFYTLGVSLDVIWEMSA